MAQKSMVAIRSRVMGQIGKRGALPEGLSYCSNNIEFFCVRKFSYDINLLRKQYHSSKHFLELTPHYGVKTAGKGIESRNYVSITLCMMQFCDAGILMLFMVFLQQLVQFYFMIV